MKTESIQRTDSTYMYQNQKEHSIAKAGIGAFVATAAVWRYFPLSAKEEAQYFNPSAMKQIDKEAENVMFHEIEEIKKGFATNEIKIKNTLPEDIFESSAKKLLKNPSATLDVIENLGEDKEIVKTLVDKAVTVGSHAKKIAEAHITSHAKQSREILFAATIGALTAMSVTTLINSINALFPESKRPEHIKEHKYSDADIYLNSAEGAALWHAYSKEDK